jgi:hypothetical protein
MSTNQKTQEYKECSGKGCQNAGSYYLKIIYLNKSGWFCKGCRNDLMFSGLVKGPSLESDENIWQK